MEISQPYQKLPATPNFINTAQYHSPCGSMRAEHIFDDIPNSSTSVTTRSSSEADVLDTRIQSKEAVDLELYEVQDSEFGPGRLSCRRIPLAIPETLQQLVPSFFRWSKPTSNTSTSLRATSYFDGVRGVAALLVFFHHYILDYYPTFHYGYGSGPGQTWLLQLPFVRILYSGRFMVTIFFVLSGYVLSMRPLELIGRRDFPGLFDSLVSSILRRGPRLYLPVIIPTFLTMLCIHWGWYGSLEKVVPSVPQEPIFQQITSWFQCLSNIVYPLTWELYSPHYATHLWTLPVEFRGSMIVFVMLLAFSKTATSIRMAIGAMFAIYCLWSMHWELFLFLSGMLLAESGRLRKANTPLIAAMSPQRRAPAVIVRTMWQIMFFLAVHIGCWPDDLAGASPGFRHLARWTPRSYAATEELMQRFWTTVGAVMLLAALEHLPAFQRVFTTSAARYLGSISYALYIVHIPILYTFGRRVTLDLTGLTGPGRGLGFFAGFVLAACIVIPVNFCVADVAWRLLDVKSVELTKSLSKKLENTGHW